jgi:D-alanyl-D-alanine carboxypeptidase/D-alanyl-D-alanine-endopeptidase (penicillin-binding protein 4)
VVSLTRGDTLYAHNAGEEMVPASTMKLLTSALAFEQFGPTYQFSTDALRDGTVGSDGTLSGNLYIRGDGDPAPRRSRCFPGNQTHHGRRHR